MSQISSAPGAQTAVVAKLRRGFVRGRKPKDGLSGHAWRKDLRIFGLALLVIAGRLNTFEEIAEERTPYVCEFLVSIPRELKTDPNWPKKREEIEDDIIKFWDQFKPGIVCETVDVLGADEITLDHMSRLKRFDADWLSFSEDDDYPVTPLAADLRT